MEIYSIYWLIVCFYKSLMEEKREPYRVRLLKAPCVSSDEVSRWLCRRMNLPCGKGPEGRYDFESMVETDRRAFSKFNRGDQPPDERAPLTPLREDVTLIDPCSGQLSSGAQVHLEAKSRTPFIDKVYTASDLWVPAGVRDRPQTPQPDLQLWYMTCLSTRGGTPGWNQRQHWRQTSAVTAIFFCLQVWAECNCVQQKAI